MKNALLVLISLVLFLALAFSVFLIRNSVTDKKIENALNQMDYNSGSYVAENNATSAIENLIY